MRIPQNIKRLLFGARLVARHYSLLPEKRNPSRRCILRIDGRIPNGGLCDRLRGIAGIYLHCKVNNHPFGVLFDHPFELQEILRPNRYDWRVTKDETGSSIWDVSVAVTYGGGKCCPSFRRRQTHVYNIGGGNLSAINASYGTDYSFGSLFHELFRPTDRLAERIEQARQPLKGRAYVAVCYRFMSLLGDFYEGDRPVLHGQARTRLMEQAAAALQRIRERHPGMPVLVTSDSGTFLESLAGVPDVVTIPGKVVHMDYTAGEQIETYMKSFTDLYLLSGGVKIYRMCGGGLYTSGFPNTAALMSGIPMEDIDITGDGTPSATSNTCC